MHLVHRRLPALDGGLDQPRAHPGADDQPLDLRVFPSAETENTLGQNVFLVLVAASVLVAVVTRILRGRAERAPAPAPEQN
ncbi:hypothetical protein [Thermobifida cellulosilytica]|uniref:Uncharacterized protein n=1 Tax=Thermobifida cellulosilytica TB100 TaxID=665004 RepID=A0A147KHP7_THECS|nr:hypothetical protein [Thermobifida cellulosilytica]KUP96824.1 hypothetical protein AC529_10135 [Thermobifida cellulosilytica TB100]